MPCFQAHHKSVIYVPIAAMSKVSLANVAYSSSDTILNKKVRSILYKLVLRAPNLRGCIPHCSILANLGPEKRNGDPNT